LQFEIFCSPSRPAAELTFVFADSSGGTGIFEALVDAKAKQAVIRLSD
jgi:hypothetical protein